MCICTAQCKVRSIGSTAGCTVWQQQGGRTCDISPSHTSGEAACRWRSSPAPSECPAYLPCCGYFQNCFNTTIAPELLRLIGIALSYLRRRRSPTSHPVRVVISSALPAGIKTRLIGVHQVVALVVAQDICIDNEFRWILEIWGPISIVFDIITISKSLQVRRGVKGYHTIREKDTSWQAIYISLFTSIVSD